MTDRIPVVTGENIWRLLRTDRDGATREEVLVMVGPAMHHLLHEAGEQFGQIDPWQIVVETTPEGDELPHQWRIGAARPIVASSASRGPLPDATTELPQAARVLGSRILTEEYGLPTVRGKNPWWIIVRFWWRQPDSEVDYPGYAVNAIGWHEHTTHEADWVLDKAIVPAAPDPDPGEETFGQIMGPRITESIKTAVSFGAGTVVVLGLIAAAVYFGPALVSRSRKAGAT